MIILDTHIWVWWVTRSAAMPARLGRVVEEERAGGLGVSIISCWEVAKLVERGRLGLSAPTLDWLNAALALPDVRLLPLTPRVVAEATSLPGEFHRDPADQLIVATARVLEAPLLTVDARICGYPHVPLAEPAVE